ncbi:MAG: hypothetical protein ACKVI6_05140 [Candidatus Poseidoniales archaeon]
MTTNSFDKVVNGIISIVNLRHPNGKDTGSLVADSASSMGAKLTTITSNPDEDFNNFNYGNIDWRHNLQNTHWLVNSSTTVLEGESPKNAWAASMIFGELEGSKTVMVVDLPKDITRLSEMWGAVISKIRQIHILFLTSDALKFISKLEKVNKDELLNQIRISGLIPLVCSYDETSREVNIVHSTGSVKLYIEGKVTHYNWLANFLYKLPTQNFDNQGLKISASFLEDF